MLHQINRIASIGLHKVRQQTVRVPTHFAPNPLDQDSVADVSCAHAARVGSPTDQTIAALTFRMGTFLGNRELSTRKRAGFGVLLYRTGEVLYNDHIFGTPPPVVQLASIESHWEVSSFLTRLYAIIPTNVCSVKLERSRFPLATPYLMSNQCDRLLLAPNSYLPPNYSIWPGLSIFWLFNFAANSRSPEVGRLNKRNKSTVDLERSEGERNKSVWGRETELDGKR